MLIIREYMIKTENYKWSRVELILVLDLYLNVLSDLSVNKAEEYRMLQIIFELLVIRKKIDVPRARTIKSITAKIENFKAINPLDHSTFDNFSKLDQEVFNFFENDLGLLSQVASSVVVSVYKKTA